MGIVGAGAIATPLNQRWSPEEAASAASGTDPISLIVCLRCGEKKVPHSNIESRDSQLISTVIQIGKISTLESICLISDDDDDGVRIRSCQEFLQMLLTKHQDWKGKILSCFEEDATNADTWRWLHPPVEFGNTALLCFTSGSTGKPKAVAVTHRALMFQSLAKLSFVPYTSDSLFFTINPLPEVELGSDTTLCDTASLVISAFNPGATYEWSNSEES